MARIVGIDLGTSTSEIAVFAHGRPQIILNQDSNPITPSAVWAAPNGELMVGEHAYRQWGSVREFKREMGVAGKKFKLEDHALAPEECSALLLRYLKKCAESQLQEKIDRAVITVPASWKDGPRRATQEAGRLAGFEVERLINEPTAAAMAFGARPEAEGKTIAVYDLGGGTFDVTILRIQDKVFDVATSFGDGHLGGCDIDKLLRGLVLEKLRNATGYEHRLGLDKQKDYDLLLLCEAAKKELSSAAESRILFPAFAKIGGQPIPIDTVVKRTEFNSIIEPLIDRSLKYFEEALRRARLPKESIDEIVMVGGSTRIPLVRQRVAELMNKEPNTRDINPDEAVALGAAIQAGILEQPEMADDSFLALDNVNHHLGVESLLVVNDHAIPGSFCPIIYKDDKVPVSKAETFSTVVDNQTEIKVTCYQGSYPTVDRNEMIGDPITVKGLPPRPAGQVSIVITFGLSASEILDVNVQIEEAGISELRSFDLARGQLSEAKRMERQRALDKLWEGSELASRYRILINQAAEALKKSLPAATRANLEKSIGQLKAAIQANDSKAAVQADIEISNILFDLI